MNFAYKFLKAGEDVLFIFDQVERNSLEEHFLRYVKVDGSPCLQIGTDLFIPLEGVAKELLCLIAGCQQILIGESAPHEFEVRYISSVPVDKLEIGKALAYVDIANTATALQFFPGIKEETNN